MELNQRAPSEFAALTPMEAFQAGENVVGGKAWGLSQLAAASASVPVWKVVPATACRKAIERSGLLGSFRLKMEQLRGLDPQKAQDRARIDQMCQTMREQVESLSVTAVLSETMIDLVAELGDGPFAVRSSMVGEDSGSHSFAGQLDSYLFQRPVDLPKAIARCWGSAFSSHATLYRLQAELFDVPSVAVVVQNMVSGVVSGVAFTAHPVTGRRQHTLITGAWGLGEGIVSGACNTDEYIWSHEGHEVSVTIAEKDIMVIPHPGDEPGTMEHQVPLDRQDVRCLSVDVVAELGQELTRLQDHFGEPIDVEWTIADERLYILQARPITSLPPEPDLAAPMIVFDNSNIQESYCGVTTPLTFSFAQNAYASVYAQTMRAGGLSEETIKRHDSLLRNLLGLVAGRVYYNINNWYRGLLLLPSFGKNKADMERMMGLEEPVDFVEDTDLSLIEKLKRLPQVLGTLLRLIFQFSQLKVSVPRWLSAFETAYASIDRDSLPNASLSQLMATLDQLDESMLENWHTPIINDFFVMMSVGKLRRHLSSGSIADPDDLINRLLAGEEDIESTQPVRRLLEIASEVRVDPVAVRIVNDHEPGRVVDALRGHSVRIEGLIDDYIERYGDRSMGELKLETITLREDTTFMAHVLKGYVARDDLRPEVLSRREKSLRSAAESMMSRSLTPRRLRAAMRSLKSARSAVKNRESMRLARTRLFGLYRQVYLGIGMRLSERGHLAQPRDIFYLTIDDVRAYFEGRSPNANLSALAQARRLEFEAYGEQEAPHRIEATAPVYQNMPCPEVEVADTEKSAGTLRGVGCYPGVVEAEIRVIRSPQDELSVDGQILTAMRTDPGWAPLFPTCSGILIERGSTLSHSAVVARELGIPAVVGVKHLLSIVEDGERARLDGQRGVVSRLDFVEPDDGAESGQSVDESVTLSTAELSSPELDDKVENITGFVLRHADSVPEKIALVIPKLDADERSYSESKITFAELALRVGQARQGLTVAGFSKGDRVILMAPVSLDLYAMLLAILGSGMSAVFIDVGMGRKKVLQGIKDSNAQGIITVHALLKYRWFLPELWGLKKFGVDCRGWGIQPWSALFEETPMLAPVVTSNRNDHALITFTSGSTGRPKGADRTQGLLVAQHLALSSHFPSPSETVDLQCFPVVALHNLCLGITTVLPAIDLSAPATVNPSFVLRQIGDWGVTRMSGAPAYIEQIVAHLESRGERETRIRALGVGGAPVSADLCRRITERFTDCESVVIYGSTEAEPIASVPMSTICETSDLADDWGYLVGPPAGVTEVALVRLPSTPVILGEADIEPFRVEAGEVGEMIVRGPHVNRSYLDNPRANQLNKLASADGQVWHRTGDMARFDSDGRIWLCGRLKDCVRWDGKSVHPLPIEARLDRVPGIARAALVNDDSGRRAALFVALAAGTMLGTVHPILTSELACYGLNGVAIHVRDAIPMDYRHQSKIDRVALRNEMENQ